MRPLVDRDEPDFEEIRDFVADEAEVLSRLESVLSLIGQQVRTRAAVGLDSTEVWAEVERRLGWNDDDDAPARDGSGS